MLNFLKKQINLKFRFLHKYFANTAFNLLDVGAGNNSASRTKALLPNCKYYGLDISKSYSNSETDFNKMEKFYELDLTLLDYSAIPNNFFDAIMMAHVIEHLHNGEEVLPLLVKKLKPGGYFYIEYPGKKSTTLPSMYGTLNFKDDPTHVRLYSVNELKKVFEKNNCTVLACGIRRNYYYILAMPFRVIYSFIKTGKVTGNIFWDILGFAEYLKVKRNMQEQTNEPGI